MTLKEFYDSIGGDYEDIMKRISKEDMVLRFLHKFENTEDFQKVELTKASTVLCEEVRHGAPTQDLQPMLEELMEKWRVYREKLAEV